MHRPLPAGIQAAEVGSLRVEGKGQRGLFPFSMNKNRQHSKKGNVFKKIFTSSFSTHFLQ
jgi:hypothetical protein